MHALPVNLPCVKQLPVITNEAGASPHAGSTCAIGVVTVRPFNRRPAQLYFKLTPDPNNTFFFIFTCTTQYPWVLANPDLSQAMASSKQKRTHTVFRASSTHRSASTSKPRFVGEKVRLGDVATYVNGYAFKPSDYSDSGLPIVRIQNLTGNAYRTNRYEGTLPEKFAIQDGDILISWSASLGVFEWNQGPAWLNQHIFRVVFNKAMIDKRFSVHQARFLIQKSQNLAHGATMKHLTKKVFETLPFLYLGLNNQITIAEQLDALDTQINRAKRQIRFLDNLAKSRFVEMFKGYVRGGNTVALSELCEFVTVGIANATTHAYADDGIVMLRNLNVRENYLDDSDLIKINPDFAAKYSKKTLKAGDILVTRTGYPGIACVVPEKYAGCQTFTTLIARLKSDAQIIPLFLSFWINSPVGKEFVERMKAGSSQQNFGATSLKLLEVPLPPLSLQQEFAAFVSQVDKSGFATHCDHPRASY